MPPFTSALRESQVRLPDCTFLWQNRGLPREFKEISSLDFKVHRNTSDGLILYVEDDSGRE